MPAFSQRIETTRGDHQLPFSLGTRHLSGAGFAALSIVTGSDFRFVVIEQLAALDLAAENILIEPEARNTAAAICAAVLAVQARHGDALMLVAPSDHLIPDATAFTATVLAGVPAALSGQLVTFGIRPDRSETGYGWLELPYQLPEDAPAQAHPLKAFVEKPDADTATQLLAGGLHLWNAGIFLFTTRSILEAFERCAPDILEKVRAAFDGAQEDLSITRLAAKPWTEIEAISIDKAVMEHANNLSVVQFSGAWSDLGDWQADWRESAPDGSGIVTNGAATAIDCHGTLLHATSEAQQLVGLGLTDIIAVAMPDAVLVAYKDRAQDVKLVVEELKSKGVPQAETLPRDYRPWGWYECLVLAPRFQVKSIVVKPGGSLSLQSHHHRAEHWIVIEGTARVTIHDEAKLVAENQSVFIPVGAKYRLENPGMIPLTLIEVQSGAYLGEDDITRYDDVYARGRGAKG